MPSMLTHRVLGDDVLKKLDPSMTVMQSIDQGFELYSIGTSGPDIFFFYKSFPWSDSKKAARVSKYGSLMHQLYTKDMFRVIVKRCNLSKDPLQISYVSGLMLHWALDHIAHPYVYNRTGHGKEADNTHRAFESQLDRGVIDWKGIDITKFKPQDVVSYLPDTWYPIWQIYSEVLEKVWGLQLKPEEMEQSVRDFRKMEEILFDPSGKKIKPFARLEGLMGIKGLATSMVIPLKMDPAWNVMNEDHDLWRHPSTGEEHHESFRELFDQARASGEELLTAFNEYLENDLPEEHVLDVITGNFHTGLPVPDDMKYFNLVPTKMPEHLFDK